MIPVQIKPQPGPQTAFLSCEADVVFYGGQAGGGKTWSLLIEPMRHYNHPGFTALTFRRSAIEIRNPGGLWDASRRLYSQFQEKYRPRSREKELDWTFKSGVKFKFAHLMNDATRFAYQGAEICFLAFDEITHFSFDQFTYLLSRNRSTCGIKPYCRATCNPDKDSWVRRFIDWWIDPDTGLAILERSGIIRYFVNVDNEIIWSDTPEPLFKYYTEEELSYGVKPYSFTFIPATLFDNKALLTVDPGYISRLRAQNKVEQERLLGGNWNISYSDFGCVLNRNDFSRYDNTLLDHKGNIIFPKFIKTYFVIDTASTTKTSSNYSVVGLFGQTADNRYYIIDWFRARIEEPDLEQKIVDMWYHNKKYHILNGVWIEATSASAGTIIRLQRKGLPVFKLDHQSRDKFLRLNDGLGIIKNRFVHLPLQAAWVETFLAECEAFRADMKHVLLDKETIPLDDQVDVLAYALSSQINLISKIGIYKKPETKIQKKSFIYD